jgi:hypothetical protein
MVYRGRVQDGVVVLEGRVRLKEGTAVSVRPLRTAARPSRRQKQPPTLYERYKRFIGKANSLPPDASINHDHYLYGAPKVQ